MDMILETLARVFEVAGNFAATSTSMVLIYQPEKPACLKKSDSESE